MNREMKFRAILKKEARGRDQYQTEVVIFTLENMMRGKVVFAYPEHWDFCEYTGLLDKNGKEIYEGDVVEFESGDIWKVYFAEGGAQFRLETPEEDDFLDMSEGMQLEVIGDIYSNPDLLTPPDTK